MLRIPHSLRIALFSLEVPIMIYSDVDFESLDGKSTRRDDSWLEMPLKSDRHIPFRCAVSAVRLSPVGWPLIPPR